MLSNGFMEQHGIGIGHPEHGSGIRAVLYAPGQQFAQCRGGLVAHDVHSAQGRKQIFTASLRRSMSMPSR